MIKFTQGKNCLKINDLVNFTLLDPNVLRVRDDFMSSAPGQARPQAIQSMPSTGQGLRVRLAATHAGIITRNNGFYTPDKMRRGASTFTEHFPKPILVHHQDDASDPIGRVIESRYVDTIDVVKDQFKIKNGLVVKDHKGKERGVITEVLLQDFANGNMPFAMQVDTIRTLFRDSLLEDKNYAGMGYIELIANISDPAAIPKLLDGRYITGSVGATTDRAVCSVCKQDWTEDGKCDHRPGAIYDGAKCFIIAGDLIYDEYSFVNVPADRHSKVLELHYNGIRDNVEIADEFAGRIYEVNLGFPQYDSVSQEDNAMLEKTAPQGTVEIKDSTAPADQPPKVEDQKVTPVEDDVKPKYKNGESGEHADDCPCAKCVAARAAAKDQQAKVPGPGNNPPQDVLTAPVTQVTNSVANEESFDDFMTRVLSNAKLTDKDQDKLYGLMWEEIQNAKADGELATVIEDAKLSSEKRGKLAKSTFCGPNKSFPVPDCAHVVAARRLIGRYKGEGDKSAILACVARKAKALGCQAEKKQDQVQDAVVVSPTEVAAPAETAASASSTVVADECHEVALVKKLFETEAKEKDKGPENAITAEEAKALRSILRRLGGLLGRDALVDMLAEEGLALSPECEKALLDEVAKTEDTIGQLRDELAKLKTEYADTFKDMEKLQDAVANANVASRKTREAHAKILKTLRDGQNTDSDFTVLTDEALSAEVARLSGEVDMVKITDKLGNGMSREPNGIVKDPTHIQDIKANPQKSEIALVDALKVQEGFMTALFKGGPKAAEAYISRMKAMGLVPDNK